MQCKDCGNEITNTDFEFCPFCGASLAPNMKMVAGQEQEISADQKTIVSSTSSEKKPKVNLMKILSSVCNVPAGLFNILYVIYALYIAIDVKIFDKIDILKIMQIAHRVNNIYWTYFIVIAIEIGVLVTLVLNKDASQVSLKKAVGLLEGGKATEQEGYTGVLWHYAFINGDKIGNIICIIKYALRIFNVVLYWVLFRNFLAIVIESTIYVRALSNLGVDIFENSKGFLTDMFLNGTAITFYVCWIFSIIAGIVLKIMVKNRQNAFIQKWNMAKN